jgi:uncharacterized protein (TIGR00730 family)
MAALRRVCVFCGSKHGVRHEYTEAARAMGTALVAAGIDLVYGGGRIGLMGEVADAVLAASGEVIGIIPEHMSDREIAHDGVTDLRIVGSMHERKALMYELSDAFIALPGGLGTLDELFETLTWAQIGLHDKPIGLLDVAGFFAPLRQFLDHAARERFIKARHLDRLVVDDDSAALVSALEAEAARRRSSTVEVDKL